MNAFSVAQAKRKKIFARDLGLKKLNQINATSQALSLRARVKDTQG